MSKYHGVGLNFGVGSTVVGVNGLFQTREHNYVQESEEIKDTGDTAVSKCFWNQMETSTFTYVATSVSTNLLGTAPVTVPFLGRFVSVIDQRYPAIAGNWLVEEITTASSNTSATRVTLRLSRYPFIRR